MVSLGMLPALASRTALRRRALPSGSPPPLRAATVISLINLVNSLPRLASSAPFLCLILCHFECPDICTKSFWRVCLAGRNIPQPPALFQLFVFFPRLNQHGQIGIGVFPQRKEILVRLSRAGGVAVDRGGPGQSKMRERVTR